ncbi:M18 family aminopeptidase [Cellulomonas edaphi]|uniref:M18 family aminopeptidase n=1 Tax=Cellulomonas edaphi TaxID=3053468 RepID=A0ABT7S3K1_9CELL|nr:M18 family aminopeptidase [Cellulomons edaphi]MDM7830203.1 M18 family aminopeptidase [Cellulomons edaphi]
MPPADAHAHVTDLAAFVAASPSSFHAAHEVSRRAVAAGFSDLSESDAWPAGPGRHVVVRDGAAIAWVVPVGAGPTTPVTVLGTHTDSPGFTLKPTPDASRAGWRQASVEVYGGPLLNSWLDRELALAGRVATRDGEHLVRTGPLLRIPQLAIHLDRQANDGLALDKQRHTQPVWGIGDAPGLLAAVVDGVCDPADVLGWDLSVVDTQEARVFGADDELFASPRLDNLLSTHAALTALLATEPDVITVLAAFDHEEVGSATRSGAAGPFLQDVLSRIRSGLGADGEQAHRALASSLCVSSDVGHSVHPNYAERHDPGTVPVAGGGPILKINANQRYATDAAGAALWQAACERAGVPSQAFVSNNAVPCGSTIGPITATRLGLRTVDVGVPILSMHSARELCAVVDPWYLTRAMAAVLSPAP